MRTSRPPAERDVLVANDLFYTAFSEGDLVAMNRLWSRENAVTCIHPGWHVLVGRDAVLASWKAIFDGEGSTSVMCVSPQVVMLAEGAALVVCIERLGESELAASNVFVLEDGVWCLVHHQSGVMARGAPPEDGSGEAVN